MSAIQHCNSYEDPKTLSNRWEVWLKRFERFIVAMSIQDTTVESVVYCSFHGCDVENIFEHISQIIAAKQTTMYSCQETYGMFRPNKENNTYVKFIYFASHNNAKVKRSTSSIRDISSCQLWSKRVNLQLAHQMLLVKPRSTDSFTRESNNTRWLVEI